MNCDIYTPTGMHWCPCHKAHKARRCVHKFVGCRLRYLWEGIKSFFTGHPYIPLSFIISLDESENGELTDLEFETSTEPKVIVKTLLALIMLAASIVAGNSQAFTNLPTTTLADENVAVSTAAVMRGAAESFESAILLDYTFKEHFFARAEIQNSDTANVVNSLALGGGVCKSWETAKAYGFLLGRRNWTTDRWEGVGGIGVAYSPLYNAGNLLSNFSLFTEARIVVTDNRRQPATETLAGLRYSFRF